MNRALQWKLVAGFLLVFIAGGMTGAFFGASHARHVFFEPHRRGIMGERMLERLRTQLTLTPEQVAKISPIIEKTATQLEQVRRETGQKVREVFQGSHQEIATHLTDDQRAKLEQIEARHRAWHRRGFHGRSPVPPSKKSET